MVFLRNSAARLIAGDRMIAYDAAVDQER